MACIDASAIYSYDTATMFESKSPSLEIPASTLQIFPQVIKRGFGLKHEVAPELDARYNRSAVVDYLKAHGGAMKLGKDTLYLAEEFGFCYGVDKAIDFAYETRRHFPDRRIFLTDEIIHNPRVNTELMEIGIRFLSGIYSDGISIDDLKPEDVVLIPAFGTTTVEEARLRAKGCTLVDTTCGSVVHVWKRVEKYASEGFTSVIHGKYYHEETRATCSRVLAGGRAARYLVIRDREQAAKICSFIIEGKNRDALIRELKESVSPNFNIDTDLEKLGVANQTTMLATESLEIAEMLKRALEIKFGTENIKEHFRAFGTICSATQDRQDALLKLTQARKLDLILVVGGYNSSNTSHLLEIALTHAQAYHVQDASSLISGQEISHKLLNNCEPLIARSWLRQTPLAVGITSGASTPNRVLEEVILRFFELRGFSSTQILATL